LARKAADLMLSSINNLALFQIIQFKDDITMMGTSTADNSKEQSVENGTKDETISSESNKPFELSSFMTRYNHLIVLHC